MSDYYFIKHSNEDVHVYYTSLMGGERILTLPVQEAEKLLQDYYDGSHKTMVNGLSRVYSLDLTQITEISCAGITVRFKNQNRKALIETYKEAGTYPTTESASGNSKADEPEKGIFRVECKCGAEYTAKMYRQTERVKCRICNETTWVDRNIEPQQEVNGEYSELSTNKYYVKRSDGNGRD